MARVTIEDCLAQVENRFALVILGSKRTKQLLKGSQSLVGKAKNKEVIMSLREIAAGKVKVKGSKPPAKKKGKS